MTISFGNNLYKTKQPLNLQNKRLRGSKFSNPHIEMRVLIMLND